MRICLYTPSFSSHPTGVHVTVDALARQFTQRGHLVSVLAMGDAQPMHPPYAVHWISAPFGPRWFPERSATALRRYQQANDFEIMLCIDAHPTGYGALRVTQEYEIPLVVASMSGDVLTHSPLRQRAHLWKRITSTYHNADTVVAISPYLRQRLEALDDGGAVNLVSIHSGVDTQAFSRPAQRPDDFHELRPFVLCIADLIERTGVDEALAAYQKVRRRLGEAMLVILGEGPRETALRRQIRVMELDDDVIFAGSPNGEARRWFLQHAKYAIVVPMEEGHPMVGLQVAASGRPMICSSPGAYDEICRGGVNGLRVPSGAPNALADAMLRMQRFDLETMGLNSLEIVQDYDWSRVAARYLELFELLRAGPSQAYYGSHQSVTV